MVVSYKGPEEIFAEWNQKLAELLNIQQDNYDTDNLYLKAIEEARERSALKYITWQGVIHYIEAVVDHFDLPENLKYKITNGFGDYEIFVKRLFTIDPVQALDV